MSTQTTHPLDESRAWAAASWAPTADPGELCAYERAHTDPSALERVPIPRVMPATEDATAARGGNPLITAAVLGAVGLALGTAGLVYGIIAAVIS